MLPDLPPTASIAVFGASAPAVWFAGTCLVRDGDLIAEETGIGREFRVLYEGGVAVLSPRK